VLLRPSQRKYSRRRKESPSSTLPRVIG
jgi:hypothetical protein